MLSKLPDNDIRAANKVHLHLVGRVKLGSQDNKTILVFFKNFFFFLMWTSFKVFTEFVTILSLFYVLDFWLWGM